MATFEDERDAFLREQAERFRKKTEEFERTKRERAIRLAADIERGNPGRRSPASVVADAVYERVHPTSVLLVVRHREKGTLWGCSYATRDDSSDAECEAQWYEVEEKRFVVTKYVLKEG